MPKLRRRITFVVGGARSGKSRYAQELAGKFQRVVFLATSCAVDAEIRSKIAQHRQAQPSEWKTVEVPTHLPDVICSEARNGDALLIDCFTFLCGKCDEA